MVNIDSGNGLAPSYNKSLSEPMLDYFIDALVHNVALTSSTEISQNIFFQN